MQEEEIKGMKIGKEIVKVSLFGENMILYLKDTKKSPKTLRHHKQFQQCSRKSINLQKSVAFLYTNNE
jgi:hypothetical protein